MRLFLSIKNIYCNEKKKDCSLILKQQQIIIKKTNKRIPR